ncbi:hypothetical protein, partial [Mycobacterium colombiense]|uniref:hypothetical protein n=1 Tax=Mycobacterium colombiense TaxID=339268 RepID=UPI001BB0058A
MTAHQRFARLRATIRGGGMSWGPHLLHDAKTAASYRPHDATSEENAYACCRVVDRRSRLERDRCHPATGGIGSIAIRAIQRRPNLDLVGVW